MAAFNEPDTFTISVEAGTQMVKTEFDLNVSGYIICQDPGSILFVQPNQNAAADFSKDRFTAMVDATPALSALVKKPRYRDSDSTTTHKSFPGGAIDFVGG